MLRPGSDTKSYVAAGIRHKIMCCRWSPAQHVVTNFSNSIRFCCLIILQFWVVCPSSCWIFGNLCQVLPSKRCGTQFRDQQYTNCASWVGARSHKKCGSGNCRCVNLEHMNVAMQHTHTHFEVQSCLCMPSSFEFVFIFGSKMESRHTSVGQNRWRESNRKRVRPRALRRQRTRRHQVQMQFQRKCWTKSTSSCSDNGCNSAFIISHDYEL